MWRLMSRWVSERSKGRFIGCARLGGKGQGGGDWLALTFRVALGGAALRPESRPAWTTLSPLLGLGVTPSSTFFAASPSFSASLALNADLTPVSFLFQSWVSLGDTQGFTLGEFCGMFCAANKRSCFASCYLCLWCDCCSAVSRSSSVSAAAWNFEASVAAAQLGLGEYVCKRV